jgi:hypothetical protein
MINDDDEVKTDTNKDIKKGVASPRKTKSKITVMEDSDKVNKNEVKRIL